MNVTVYPEERQKELQREYEREQANQTSIMGQFFGDGTAWQGVIPEGHSIYYNSPEMEEKFAYSRANSRAFEGFMIGYMTGAVATPIAITGAITTAPVWMPVAAQGMSYAWQGARLIGNYSWQALRSYHNIFGKNGGYGSIGANYFIQSGQTGSMNPMNHNTFGYIGSAFTPSSISSQMVVGAAGGLINYTPNNEIPLRGFWNRHIGITTVEMINGGLSPLYMLGGARIGFIFGATQQIVGGRAIDYLEKTIPN